MVLNASGISSLEVLIRMEHSLVIHALCLWLMKSLEDQVMGELDLTGYKMKRIQLMLFPWKCTELGELAAEVENNWWIATWKGSIVISSMAGHPATEVTRAPGPDSTPFDSVSTQSPTEQSATRIRQLCPRGLLLESVAMGSKLSQSHRHRQGLRIVCIHLRSYLLTADGAERHQRRASCMASQFL
ncbi:hypothetical protein MUK42_26466 [Musa troglodytarum]|uniref:Uncharacterized protein n=1 Tax=Musa troglodytarum TaxID=320322 RepID=A0A9E7IFQ9_9LILI|nr:hypothetical protein MUK42_26466 [Musa troglodytarum]